MSRGKEVEVTLKSGKSQLHILGIQSNVVWENPEANRVNFEKQIREGVLKNQLF